MTLILKKKILEKSYLPHIDFTKEKDRFENGKKLK